MFTSSDAVWILGDVSLGRYNKTPRMRVQKAENVNKALEFITSRGVKLTNIGPEGLARSDRSNFLLNLLYDRYHRWQSEVDPWYDLDADSPLHNSGYQVCRLSDLVQVICQNPKLVLTSQWGRALGQGRPSSLVSAQDSTLQGSRCARLFSQLVRRTCAVSVFYLCCQTWCWWD